MPSDAETIEQVTEKRRLYFEAGADEVWICDAEGQMTFFTPDSERDTSARVPDFPKRVEL